MGRTVLITGGTRGIGLGIAHAFADLGDTVTVTGLTRHEVDAVKRQHDNLSARRLDVTNEKEVDDLVSELSRLDILVNSAGTILRDGQEHHMAGFSHTVEVNLNGTARMAYACHELLAQARGCIVNIASMLSMFGSGASPGYSASKGGVNQLTRSHAIAWAQDGIRVNAIAPGWIESELTRPIVEDDPVRNQEILDRTPLARWGTPADVSGAATFLCSPAAAFITGVTLPVDGGYSIR